METLDLSADIIDVRDIIARAEELEAEQPLKDDEDLAELDTLKAILNDLKGNGGDEEWDGDWYPLTLVRDSYWEDYAREEAESLGLVKDDAQWPARHIDWEAAANELQQDYTSTEINGTDYWYR